MQRAHSPQVSKDMLADFEQAVERQCKQMLMEIGQLQDDKIENKLQRMIVSHEEAVSNKLEEIMCAISKLQSGAVQTQQTRMESGSCLPDNAKVSSLQDVAPCAQGRGRGGYNNKAADRTLQANTIEETTIATIESPQPPALARAESSGSIHSAEKSPRTSEREDRDEKARLKARISRMQMTPPHKQQTADLADNGHGENHGDPPKRTSQAIAGYHMPHPETPHQLFPDADQLKHQMAEQLLVQAYDVKNFYWEEGTPGIPGFVAKIARANWFEHLTLFLIAMNAVWLAYDADENNADIICDAEIQFQIVDNFFCFYFTLEITIRFLAFKEKRNCFKDFWFCFDSFLVAEAIFEVWFMYFLKAINVSLSVPGILSLLKMLRMCRCARLVRLLRKFPELIMIMRGIIIALRSVSFTGLLMIIITYMFAIAMKSQTKGNPELEGAWSHSVISGVAQLLIDATCPDLSGRFFSEDDDNRSLAHGGSLNEIITTVIYIFFLLLVMITMANMLIGILCEVISAVAQVEKAQLDCRHMKDGLLGLVEESDTDRSGYISIKEFENLLQNQEAVRFMASVDIDAAALVDFSVILFKGDKQYEHHEIIAKLMEFRGSNNCTVKDMIEMRTWLFSEMEEMRRLLNPEKAIFSENSTM
jgi:hypothetical protein